MPMKKTPGRGYQVFTVKKSRPKPGKRFPERARETGTHAEVRVLPPEERERYEQALLERERRKKEAADYTAKALGIVGLERLKHTDASGAVDHEALGDALRKKALFWAALEEYARGARKALGKGNPAKAGRLFEKAQMRAEAESAYQKAGDSAGIARVRAKPRLKEGTQYTWYRPGKK